ncbi:MAG: tRNA (adenosine(37)-N6)-threonylcarbamoyltransferase complex dimerization subunit type 1 TsaB [Chloroflexi bacterium]|nr:tRNA (adenosine(37)-N6)-threonylcarbamoyltransferase complex dimerization subunit type 1 TsaB [Chloroflexota bacterium]
MIIAIDGTSTDLSVALAEPNGTLIGDEAWSSAQRQSSALLPRLLALLDRHGRRLGAASSVAVGAGPGSFTGLRVAMALAKGLALALHLPVVGVPSMEAWLAAEPDAVAATVRSGAREAFVHLRGEPQPAIADRDLLVERIGDRPVVAPAELVDAFGIRNATAPRAAATIARMAAERLAADPSGDDLRRLEPRYLRAPRDVESTGTEVVRWR